VILSWLIRPSQHRKMPQPSIADHAMPIHASGDDTTAYLFTMVMV
jgi:hypothetical protein